MRRSAGSRSGVIPMSDRWTNEARPDQDRWLVAAASLSVLIAATMIIVLTGSSRGTVPAVMIMTAGVMALASRALARAVIVLDRRSGVVTITTAGYLWRRRRVRTLGEFDRIAVWERRKLLGEGSYATQYSVMLLGENGPLPLLTTADEREASAVGGEMAIFLHFP